ASESHGISSAASWRRLLTLACASSGCPLGATPRGHARRKGWRRTAPRGSYPPHSPPPRKPDDPPGNPDERIPPMTDLEIARRARLRPITEIAARLDLAPGDLFLYGPHMAKVDRKSTRLNSS